MRYLAHLALALACTTPPAFAALDLGEKAPDFTAQAALAGQVIQYSLHKELAKGPVVLYFFPAAFSEGCSIEAHNFAEAIEDFKALGASVIGVSRDEIDTQKRFSVSACRGKFAVASDPDQSIMKSYDAVLTLKPEYANRVSYVITPDGTVAYQYTSLNSDKHVEKVLGALRQLAKRPPAK
ncbi:peroxiredoxin [Pseudorhodoferax sp.]|uniref:peroxiredoxin n=1 Tax=Pseudorhodoferax sp. TaxID=1993553 RepID=UPI002DD68D05|nr:peroxiredoxin [Pseudorhodoferax sp.]